MPDTQNDILHWNAFIRMYICMAQQMPLKVHVTLLLQPGCSDIERMLYATVMSRA